MHPFPQWTGLVVSLLLVLSLIRKGVALGLPRPPDRSRWMTDGSLALATVLQFAPVALARWTSFAPSAGQWLVLSLLSGLFVGNSLRGIWITWPNGYWCGAAGAWLAIPVLLYFAAPGAAVYLLCSGLLAATAAISAIAFQNDFRSSGQWHWNARNLGGLVATSLVVLGLAYSVSRPTSSRMSVAATRTTGVAENAYSESPENETTTTYKSREVPTPVAKRVRPNMAGQIVWLIVGGVGIIGSMLGFAQWQNVRATSQRKRSQNATVGDGRRAR